MDAKETDILRLKIAQDKRQRVNNYIWSGLKNDKNQGKIGYLVKEKKIKDIANPKNGIFFLFHYFFQHRELLETGNFIYQNFKHPEIEIPAETKLESLSGGKL